MRTNHFKFDTQRHIKLFLTYCLAAFVLLTPPAAMAAKTPGPAAMLATTGLPEQGIVAISGATPWPLGVAQSMQVLEDPSLTLTLAQVLALPADAADGWKQGLAAPGRVLSRSAWWIKLRLINGDTRRLNMRFSFDTASFATLDFYQKQGGHWTEAHLGQTVQQSSLPEAQQRRMAFPLSLAPGETVEVVARLRSDKWITLQPRLYSESAFSANNARQMIWVGVLFGGLAALTLGTLFIAGFARSRLFLLLSLLSLDVLVYEITVSDYAQFYLWPSFTGWIPRSSLTLGLASLALFLQFVMAMADSLHVRWPARGWYRALLGLQIGLAVLAALGQTYWVSWLLPYNIFLYGLAIVAVALVLLKKALAGGRVMLLVSIYFLFQAVLRYGGHSDWLPEWIHSLTMNNSSNNPVIGLVGFYINLAVLMAWMVLVWRQRSQARDALESLQRDEQARLSDEVARQTTALNKALVYADEKNRQKTEMLGYISHDLRAPAATIIGYVQLLTQHADDAIDRQQYLQTIKRSADYQLTLIDELLEYARNELQPLALNPQSVNLAAFLDEITHFARALSDQKGNRFEAIAVGQLPSCVDIDPNRLKQVLLNLLSNAAKFTQNGRIRLTVRATDAEASSPSVQFDVSDTGVGISNEEQHSIFTAFSQSRLTSEGVGLGLFIAQRIIANMGGNIAVNSTPDQGSVFSFSIPCKIVDATLLTWTAPSSAAAPSRQTSIAKPVQMWPPAPARMELAELARDGRLTDIESWMRDTLASHPACADFIGRVQNALNVLDLTRVESMALAPEQA